MAELSIIDQLEKLMHDLRLEYHEYIELREIRYEVERMQTENAALRERLEEAVVNKCVYYINSVWNDATMTRKDEVCQGAIDYACDNFVEIAGLVLKWKEIYFTREAAESRLAEMKGGEE